MLFKGERVMGKMVQHNIVAMNANRNLGVTTAAQAKSTEKLSTGYKINRAADDAAGLSISEKMRRQVRGLTQASANAQDGISAVQTAEGALNEVHDMLQRMNELATKAANGTMSTDDRKDVQREMNSLITEIDRVATTTKFNEIYLLSGSGAVGDYTKSVNGVSMSTGVNPAGGSTLKFKLHVGSEKYVDNKIEVSIKRMNASVLGLRGLLASAASLESMSKIGIVDKTGSAATAAIETITNAIKMVSRQRSDLGAVQNRLEHTVKNLGNVIENTASAESQIRDTDMATEMVQYSKNNILAQAGQSMLAQANQSNQGVLSLLG
jgi:flagellin